MTIYKGFTIMTKNDDKLRIDERPGFQNIRIQIGATTPAFLDYDAWQELCELKFRLEVDEPPSPPSFKELASNVAEHKNDPA